MAAAPGKPTAAGVLLVDGGGRIVLVNPTYKPGWEIPGGMVEVGESPRAGARREVAEELALDVDPGPLLSLDHRSAVGHPDSVRFVFGADALGSEDLARIRLPPDELGDWGSFTLDEARSLVPPDLARVLENCLAALADGKTRYLEH